MGAGPADNESAPRGVNQYMTGMRVAPGRRSGAAARRPGRRWRPWVLVFLALAVNVVATLLFQSATAPPSPAVASTTVASCLAPAGAATAGRATARASGPVFPTGTWPVRTVAANVSPGVVDLATATAFSLSDDQTFDHGEGQLLSLNLRTDTTRQGPVFPVHGLALASGSLWVFGSQTSAGRPLGAVLCQVSPRTLRLVRQISLPELTGPCCLIMAVAGGPDRSVWVSEGGDLTRIDARDGATLARTRLASGSVASLATDPPARVLYVSLAYPTVDGTQVDQQVDELDGTTGRLITQTGATSAVVASVSGGQLTALPGGVADSFRVGMSGATQLLRAADLAVVTPPGLDEASGPLSRSPGDVFSWMMNATTIYGGGDLWIANENGVIACVDPASGAVRAHEQSRMNDALNVQLLAVDPARHRVYATADNRLLAFSPPAPCWPASSPG